MNDLVVNLILFYILILIGYLLGLGLKKFNDEIRKILTFILLFILTPITIFLALFTAIPFGFIEIAVFVILRITLCFVPQFFAFFVFLRKRSEAENPRKASILNMSGFPNNVLFPMPIILAFFGTDYIPILITFSITALIIRGTWLTWLCVHYGSEREHGFKSAIKQIIMFPPTITIILCLILLGFNVQFDQAILSVFKDINSILIFVFGNILIGFMLVNLDFKQIRVFKKDFSIVLFMRVAFSSLLFLGISFLLVFPTEIRTNTLTTLLILYMGPPAVLNTTFAEYFELDKEFTAFCVFFITILAMIYTPLFLLIGIAIF